MRSADKPAGDDVRRDPYFSAAIVGSGKPSGPLVGESERRRQRFRSRTMLLTIVLAAVWLEILFDPQLGPLLVFFLGGIAASLAVLAAAMGLGLLGFGLFTAADRLLGMIRRASRWPDD